MPALRSTAWLTKPSTSTSAVSANGGLTRERARESAGECSPRTDVSPHQYVTGNDYGLARSLCGSDGLSRASGLPDRGGRAVERVPGRRIVAGKVGRADLRRRLSRQLGACPSRAAAVWFYRSVLSGHQLARRRRATRSRALGRRIARVAQSSRR